MADRIKVNIAVVPLETASVAVDQGSKSIDLIATEVGKALSGSMEAAVTDYAGLVDVQGFLDGAANYREAVDDVNTKDISSETSATFVFIKNTGYTYSTSSALGAALSKAVKVMIGTTLISVLDPGECLVLKDDNAGIACTGIHVRTVDLDGSNNVSAGHLAVEFLVVD